MSYLPNNSFPTVTVVLDGQTRSDLNWERELKEADKSIQEGCKIFWKLELGLFNQLPASLLNTSQLMTLALAIDHFLDQVWSKYEEATLGISLYEGSLDFSSVIPWDEALVKSFREWAKRAYETIEAFNQDSLCSFTSFEEVDEQTMAGSELLNLYSADICLDILDTLAGRIPESLACYALVDATFIGTPLLQARMLSSERAPHIRWIVKGGKLPLQHSLEKPPLGICLPEISFIRKEHYSGLNECMELLMQRNIPFRVISEALLTTEWDGLDALIVTSSGVSAGGHRKLQGFCAAGGRIIYIGSPLGISEEISFSEWISQYKLSL